MDVGKLVAQLYTVKDFTQTPGEIEKTLKKVKEIGYGAVQVSGIGPIDPYHLKNLADEAGVQIVVTHVPYGRMINDFDALVKEHKIWNCEYVGLGSMPPEYSRDYDGYARFARDFSGIARKFADHGLKFVYHNHDFEFEKYNGKTGLEIIFDESDPEVFGFEIDTYWVQAGGADPVAWTRKVKGRMEVIHLKDMAIKERKQVFAEIGEGNLNWSEILKACNDIGVRWYCVEQDVCPGDPFESLAISFRNLKAM
ncbi:MAG: sugar phosphate isomerase/epimerase [Clostridiaceae bacterium]|nr:sugar phosphate isomerase/epimerase [Clostridiaceae bacterium]